MRKGAPSIARDTCRSCHYFLDEPAQLERALPGLSILSSAWGSTRGNAGLCSRYATWQDPVAGCPEFAGRRAAAFPEGTVGVT
jgi:hypothetical protein